MSPHIQHLPHGDQLYERNSTKAAAIIVRAFCWKSASRYLKGICFYSWRHRLCARNMASAYARRVGMRGVAAQIWRSRLGSMCQRMRRRPANINVSGSIINHACAKEMIMKIWRGGLEIGDKLYGMLSYGISNISMINGFPSWHLSKSKMSRPSRPRGTSGR